MRKNRKGHVVATIYFDKDDDTIEFILRYAQLESRSPENTIKYLLKKKVKEIQGDKP